MLIEKRFAVTSIQLDVSSQYSDFLPLPCNAAPRRNSVPHTSECTAVITDHEGAQQPMAKEQNSAGTSQLSMYIIIMRNNKKDMQIW